jgi:hypothetical protein
LGITCKNKSHVCIAVAYILISFALNLVRFHAILDNGETQKEGLHLINDFKDWYSLFTINRLNTLIYSLIHRIYTGNAIGFGWKRFPQIPRISPLPSSKTATISSSHPLLLQIIFVINISEHFYTAFSEPSGKGDPMAATEFGTQTEEKAFSYGAFAFTN